MDVVFGWLFISTFLSKVIEIESSIEISVGHFFVLRKHPQLRQCAVKALREAVQSKPQSMSLAPFDRQSVIQCFDSGNPKQYSDYDEAAVGINIYVFQCEMTKDRRIHFIQSTIVSFAATYENNLAASEYFDSLYCDNNLNHAYIGARISNQTDICEGLSRSWGRNQTIESEYGYVKNVHVRISYEPPLEVVWSLTDRKTFIIPGVLSTGAKLDILTHVHPKWGKNSAHKLSITLEQAYKNVSDVVYLRMSIRPSSCKIAEYENGRMLDSFTMFDLPEQFRISDRWMVSFIAQTNNTLHILANDKEVQVMQLNLVRLNYLTNVYFASGVAKEPSLPKPHFESVEFTEA